VIHLTQPPKQPSVAQVTNAVTQAAKKAASRWAVSLSMESDLDKIRNCGMVFLWVRIILGALIAIAVDMGRFRLRP
jgi:hypothetical protein